MIRKHYNPGDFAWARWGAGEIGRAVRTALRDKKRAYDVIKRIPKAERTFENTVYAIEASNDDIRETLSACDTLLNLHPNALVRGAAKRGLTALRSALVDFEYDPEMYRAFREYAMGPEARFIRARYGGPAQKLFSDMARDYRRMGFALSPAKRAELRRNLKKLQALETQFSENINSYADRIVATRTELSGLPERYIAGLRRMADGRYIVSLEYPELFPFMEHADNAEKRRELYEKNQKKGGRKNLTLLGRMLALRDRNARILGYRNHADYQTEVRMARTANTALRFVNGLLVKSRPALARELRDLTELKRRLGGNSQAKIEPWDIAYFGEKLKTERYKVASEEVQEYFPLKTVTTGMFRIYERLFGLRFVRRRDIRAWHPDVTTWEVRNVRRGLRRSGRSGAVMGYFMLDLHPRPAKYGHAAAGSIYHGRTLGFQGDRYRTPVSVMMTNFPKPTKQNPSLMSHGEVETYFHEFGHLMHQTLTSAAYASQSGSNTVLDFVEAQSQMLESWVWDARPLSLMSEHHRTNRPMPEDMMRRLISSKKHLIAYSTTRQLITALLDLTLHMSRSVPSPASLYRELVQKHLGLRVPSSSFFPAGLGHLTEYSAGYYGYMWSLVYASDMFTRFARDGILNPAVGGRYRREILAVGSSRPEMDSIVAFLGRKPNNRAFLKEIGVR